MHYDTLPTEFQGLSGKVNHIQRVSSFEWSSSCPQCGGEMHKGGNPPDRFRMWTNAHGVNKVFGWCRRCSYFWTPQKEHRLSQAEFEQWRKEQLVIEQERKAAAERAIALLQSERLWEVYHAGLTSGAMEILRSWGIREDWSGYWKLGLIPDYILHSKEEDYHTPAITIPMWQQDGTIANIKLRTLNPKSSEDRYRNLYKTGIQSLFTAFPRMKSASCLVVEGEKKCMSIAPWVKPRIQVIGLPSKTPSAETLKTLDGFEKVIVILDPDAYEKKDGISPAKRITDILGEKRTTHVLLTDKVDDMVVKYKMDINDAMRYAQRI